MFTDPVQAMFLRTAVIMVAREDFYFMLSSSARNIARMFSVGTLL